MTLALEGKLLFSKLDIKDRYWQMQVEKGEEWNFSYVLPPATSTDDFKIVVLSALQMGWSESCAFFLHSYRYFHRFYRP